MKTILLGIGGFMTGWALGGFVFGTATPSDPPLLVVGLAFVFVGIVMGEDN